MSSSDFAQGPGSAASASTSIPNPASPNNSLNSSPNSTTNNSLNISSSSSPSTSTSTSTSTSPITISISPTTSASPLPSQSVVGTPQIIKPVSSHLSSGAVAGVAVGCAALGALLTYTLMVFLRRNQSKRSARHRKTQSLLAQKSSKFDRDREWASDGRISTAIAVQQRNTSIDTFLPQQADDATVKQKVLLLFDQVELHVDNYYSDHGQQLTPEEQSQPSRYGSLGLPENLGALLETAHRKTTVIKHCLAFRVVHLISPSNTSDCLLPYEVSNMMVLSKPKPGDQNFPLALSRWRMLTAYLRPDLFDGNVLNSDEQRAHLSNLAMQFSDCFATFSQRQNTEEKVRHLIEVLRTAVTLALWLYTQPAAFKFEWGPVSDGSHQSTQAVVTLPSLLKTHDGTGAEIKPPQIIQPLIKKRV